MTNDPMARAVGPSTLPWRMAEGDEHAPIRVEVAGGPRGRLRLIHTQGLWWSGLPELFAAPPRHYSPGSERDWALLTLLLATGLLGLGEELLETDDLVVQPYHDRFRGRPVQLWLEPPQAPDDELAQALGPSVDTVMRVGCSLWFPPC